MIYLIFGQGIISILTCVIDDLASEFNLSIIVNEAFSLCLVNYELMRFT